MVFVKNNTVAVHSFGTKKGSIVLIPGNNELSLDNYQAISDHTTFKERVSVGKYSVVSPEISTKKNTSKKEEVETSIEKEEASSDESTDTESKEDGNTGSLAGFSVKNAILTVEETFDVPTLEKWLTEESRSKVLTSIKNQISKIKE